MSEQDELVVDQDLELDQKAPEFELTSEVVSDNNQKDKTEDSIEEDNSLILNQEEFIKLKLIIESLLMASDKPLSIKFFMNTFNNHNNDEYTLVRDKVKFNKKYINLALDELNTDLEDRAIELKNTSLGFRIQTRPQFATWVQKLWQEKPGRYSKATMETLAIIAYRQPITRGEIEHIRGVAVSSHIIRNLLDREWVKVVGHKELPGRPAIYATTQQFLADLNLEKLEELPTLADIKEIKQDLFAGLEDKVNEPSDGTEEIEPSSSTLDVSDDDSGLDKKEAESSSLLEDLKDEVVD